MVFKNNNILNIKYNISMFNNDHYNIILIINIIMIIIVI